MFATLDPDHIAGLVLIDGTHEDAASFSDPERFSRFLDLGQGAAEAAGGGFLAEWRSPAW